MLRSPAHSRRRTAPILIPERTSAPPIVADSHPLRIALVTEFYYPHLGGICEHVHFFAREARRRGHHVDIITSNIPGGLEEEGVIRIGHSQPIYFNGAQARLTLGFGLARRMKEVLRRGAYDIVHVHSPLNPTLPLLAIDAAECPVVGTFHTYFDRSLLFAATSKFLQQKLDRMSAAIAVSPSTVTALSKYFEAEWIVVPNGVDTDMFTPDAPPPPGVPRDMPVILFVGRFDPRNGLTALIDAFRLVRARGREAHLVIAGDGPLRGHYQRAAGADSRITFAGAVRGSRPSYYAHADIYAAPTTKASFGITLLESMACETAIVCSDIPGFRDVVAHDREALMFPSGDVKSLADVIVRLLDDEPLRRRLAKTGRLRAQEYAWPRVASTVLGVYRNVLKPAVHS